MSDGISSTLTFPHLQLTRLAEALDDTELAPPRRAQVEDLYQILRQRVYYFGLALTNDEGFSEDLMQEAFLRFYSKGIEVEHSDQAYAWLTTVIRNLVRDRYRRQKGRTPSGDQEQILASTAHPSPTQEEALFQKQRLAQLKLLVEELDGIEKECILLYSQGLKFQEIASTLGVNLSTAINKTTRAMRLMNKRAVRLKF